MFFHVFEFGRKVQNVFVFDDAKVSCVADRGDVERVRGASVAALRRLLDEKNAERRMKRLPLLALVMPLSACFGSDDEVVGPSPTTTSGRAIDGYLGEAIVFQSSVFDGRAIELRLEATAHINSVFSVGGSVADLVLDGVNFSSTSRAPGSEGLFEISGFGPIEVVGGVDLSTGEAFRGALSAPAGSATITPVTTLVQRVVEAAAERGEDVDVTTATQQIAKGLGLQEDTDLLNTDFIATPSAGLAKAAAQVASVMSVVSSAAGSSAEAAVIDQLANSIVRAGAVGGRSKVLTDTNELQNLVAAARTAAPDAFTTPAGAADLDTVLNLAVSTVTQVNTKISTAASLKEIIQVQAATQGTISESFEAVRTGASDATTLTASVSNIDEVVTTASAELETYLAQNDLGFVVSDEVLDNSDVDETLVEIDADIVDAIIGGKLDSDTISGILDGSIDQDDVVIPSDDTGDTGGDTGDTGGDTGDTGGDTGDTGGDTGDTGGDTGDTGGDTGDTGGDTGDTGGDTGDTGGDTGDTGGDTGDTGGGSGSTNTADDVIVEVAAGASISSALTTARALADSNDDTIVLRLAAGRYSENVTLDADALGVAGIRIEGANSGVSLAPSLSGSISTNLNTTITALDFDTTDEARASTSGQGPRESWIDGTITVASDDVTLDGLRLHSFNGALDFSGTDIDNFVVKNSFITGFNGADSFRYTGDGTNTGWRITDNVIGGVSAGVGGSLYLEEINGATISENVFFRPAAAHMYLTSVDNVTVSDNFFYHGLHADGANFDGLLDDLKAADGNGFGYVGYSGGAGLGYGFGYGYGADNSGASLTQQGSYGGYGGYGPTGYIPSGYGLDAYGGGGASQESFLYYGRNYIAEVKGVSSGITFDGNWGAYNSGGIQFWDEGSTANSFTNITISDNEMANFVNADQDGLLATLSSRHKSGLVGGVVVQVHKDSASNGLTVSGNKIYGTIDQVLNENDLDALIEVGGGINTVTINNNTLIWSGSVNSDRNFEADEDTQIIPDVITQGILLYGEVGGTSKTTGTIVLKDNTFNTTEPDDDYQSYAILLDGKDYGILGQLVTDVNLVSTASGHTDYHAFAFDGSVVGAGYDMNVDPEPLNNFDGTEVIGLANTSEYVVVESGTASSDIIFSNTVL